MDTTARDWTPNIRKEGQSMIACELNGHNQKARQVSHIRNPREGQPMKRFKKPSGQEAIATREVFSLFILQHSSVLYRNFLEILVENKSVV
jgi:hypothetical protein